MYMMILEQENKQAKATTAGEPIATATKQSPESHQMKGPTPGGRCEEAPMVKYIDGLTKE